LKRGDSLSAEIDALQKKSGIIPLPVLFEHTPRTK